MSLGRRYTGDGVEHASITCPYYEPLPAEKHCRHYLKNGACALPDELMCIEWLKANGHAAPSTASAGGGSAASMDGAESQSPEARGATDLFGRPLPETAQSRPPVPSVRDTDRNDRRLPPRGLITEDIEGFKALGVEVCLWSATFGEVWLVPAYTGCDRKEITPEHAATICAVAEAFPGSSIVSFEKPSEPDKENHA